jgi:hypothetical protein
MLLSELPIVQGLGSRAQEITSNVLMFGGSEIASWALEGGACYTAAERGLVYVSFPSEYSVDAGLLPWVGLRARLTRIYDAQKDETTLAFDSPVGLVGPITGNIFDQAFEELIAAIIARAGR